MSTNSLPLLQHSLESPSAFTPERLMDAVRAERSLVNEPVPPLCVRDFDGDLSDRLAEEGRTSPVKSWACFHTSMRAMTLNGVPCGIVPRTIGGPYAVLVAEQLWAAGAKVIVGITSAGRISSNLPLPSIVVVDEAIRDEGTSLHYVPPSATIVTPTPRLAELLAQELGTVASHVRRGTAWTTDAPYRETPDQLRLWAERGVLAVEMQAASLFAFARARAANVAIVALVSNGVDQATGQFDTGGHSFRAEVLAAIARAAHVFMTPPTDQHTVEAKRRGASRRTDRDPMACCCTFTNTVDQQFTTKKAGQELERFRRKGAGPTTRLLLAGIAQAGVGDGTLLDVGAGVGALTFELLDRGFRRAVIVEASAGYTTAASNEAARRGRATDIDFVSGDFLEVAGTVPMASVVALDRVVCC